MGDDEQGVGSRRPVFYTVAEAADVMRVNRATIYRAIREGAFPAVRVRNRYIVPAAAVEELAAEATQSGACVDVAAIAARRCEREAAHAIALDGGARGRRPQPPEALTSNKAAVPPRGLQVGGAEVEA